MKNLIALSFATCLIVLSSSSVAAHDHGKKGGKKSKVGHIFERADANQDGQLELSEFLMSAEQRFKAMDLNQDGYVTKEEGRDAHRQLREKRKAKRKQRREERQSEKSDSE